MLPTRLRANPQAFDPLSLNPAIWFDFTDQTKIFSDAGTTPITDGGLIYKVINKGSNGSPSDATQATDTLRPTWRNTASNMNNRRAAETTDGLRYMTFSFNGTPSYPNSHAAGVRMANTTSFQGWHGTSGTMNSMIYTTYMYMRSDDQRYATIISNTNPHAVGSLFASPNSKAYYDGNEAVLNNGATGTGNPGSTGFIFTNGSRMTAGSLMQHYFYFNRALSALEFSFLHNYILRSMGVL